ncbi:PaaI family thioesterase [Reyranella sp.]|uniref:PaaI family thioesterase n=1 Tax=Reyranella sp. TaxID=1929291 RepID=UPI003D14EA2B
MLTMTIPRRFCGPPNSGNGGYVCGMLGKHIPGAAEVTLRAPPPLEKTLAVIDKDDGSRELRDDDLAIAVGRPASLDLRHVERASLAEAAKAEQTPVVKPHEHLLPMCFVCGPHRAPGDGLRIGAGMLARPVAGGSAAVAATWTPSADLGGSDGLVSPEFLWAALDCPTGYACSCDRNSGTFDQSPILLGRMTARIEARPRPGERCVITAWETGRDGRKRVAEAAAHGESGTLLAVARATWIVVDRQVQLGRA